MKDTENKNNKIKIILIVVLVLLLIVLAFYEYSNYKKNNKNSNTTDINTMKNNLKELSFTETDKRILFDKLTDNKQILQWLITVKDVSTEEFTDEDIVKFLPVYLSRNSVDTDFMNNFESVENSTNVKLSKEYLQTWSKKVFDKEINFDNITEKIQEDKVIVNNPLGLGEVEYDMKEIEYDRNKKTYEVDFIYENQDVTTRYIMNIKKVDTQIVYLSIEKR